MTHAVSPRVSLGRETIAPQMCGACLVCARASVSVRACVFQKKSPGMVSAAPDRAAGPLRTVVGAEDPRARRTDPMCVWHSLGVKNVFVRPPSLQSRLTPPRRAPRCRRTERKICRKKTHLRENLL